MLKRKGGARMKIINRIIPLAIFLAAGCVSPVFGALSCTGGTYFAETGLGGTGMNMQQDGEACVTIGAGTITITVQNDDTVVTNVPSVLDGISLQLSGAATGIAFASTNPAVASGFIDCTVSVNPCATSSTFFDYNTNTTLTSPWSWGVVVGPSGNPINTTFSTGNPALLAGGGPLHPAGIIGTVASTTTANNGLGSGGHNDYLLGPVTFNLTFTGTAPTVTGATFYWDTNGTAQPGVLNGVPFGSPVPEPASELLLGAALLVVAKVVKSRLHGV
jgi:hypothetical protein